MNDPFIIHSSTIVYKNRWIEIQEDKITHPHNGEGVYTFVKTRDSVVVVAINDKREVYMIKTFRYPTKSWGWELPGGGGESGENFTETSKRELLEETGIQADRWDQVGKTNVWNGLATEQQYTLLARGLTLGDKPPADDSLLVSSGKFISPEQIKSMIASGEISDNQTLTSLYLAEKFLESENV